MSEQTVEYLRNAYCVATQSRDTSNQNGATLVSAQGEIIGTGVNNFAIGVKFTPERSETRPAKYRYFGHAERASIYQAARAGKKVYGATMYCPWAACCGCAKGMINSGVLTLVMHYERMQMTPERWQSSVNEALDMMTEAGMSLLYHRGPIDDCPVVLVNGEPWKPNSDAFGSNVGNYFVEMGEEI